MNNSSTGENDTAISEVSVALPDGALIAYNAYLSATIAFGGPGNLLVLLIYGKSGPVSSIDWFIIFISIYDLISSLISVPIYLTFSTGAWKHYGSDVICRLHMFVSQSVVLSSTFLICGLAIERYYKVCRPKCVSFTRGKSRNTCVATSMVATVLSLPCFVLYKNEHMHCGSVTEGLLVKLLMAYYTGMLLSFVAAVIILIFTYSGIAITILKSQINMLRHEKDQSGNQIKTKHRFGAFITTCCRKNKIHPYTSHNVSNAKPGPGSRPTRRTVEGSSDKNVYLVQSGSSHRTDNNECEIGITVTHITSGQRGDEPSTTKEWLELSRLRRAQKLSGIQNTLELPIIRPTNFTESEAHPSGLETRNGLTMEPPRQGGSKLMLTTGNNLILTTVQRLNENRRLKRSLKTTRIVFLICLIFVLSWIPPWASFINFLFMPPITKQSPTYLLVNMFCKMTFLINTFSNPILYTALNSTFRDKLKKVIC